MIYYLVFIMFVLLVGTHEEDDLRLDYSVLEAVSEFDDSVNEHAEGIVRRRYLSVTWL